MKHKDKSSRLLMNRLHPDLLEDIEDWDFDEQILNRFSTVILSDLTTEAVVEKINAEFVQRKQAAEAALTEQRYNDYMVLIEQSCRATVFNGEVAPLLPDAEYWSMLRHLWLKHTLPPHWDGSLWLKLFASPRPQRELLMSEDEGAVLAVLPALLTVYRGGVSPTGIGWTLDKDKARFFAESFAVISRTRGHPPKAHLIFKGTIPKDKVYAYLNENGDEEIVLDPQFVTMA